MISTNTPLNLVPFVSVDVETTGLDPQHDAIVEIGAVKVLGGRVIDEFSTLVSIDTTIPMVARRVHGISNDMLVGQPDIGRALDLFLRFAADNPIVEHSHRAFDIAFLEHAYGRQLAPPCLNTCTLSRKLFPFHRSHSLAECCRRFHIENDQAHRALSDARATARLLTYLVDICAPVYPRLEDLIRVASVQRYAA